MKRRDALRIAGMAMRASIRMPSQDLNAQSSDLPGFGFPDREFTLFCGDISVKVKPMDVLMAIGNDKPKNNECPNCGTKHDPVMAQRQMGGKIVSCDPPEPKDSYIVCLENPPYLPSSEFQRRCKHCNISFWCDTVVPGDHQ